MHSLNREGNTYVHTSRRHHTSSENARRQENPSAAPFNTTVCSVEFAAAMKSVVVPLVSCRPYAVSKCRLYLQCLDGIYTINWSERRTLRELLVAIRMLDLTRAIIRSNIRMSCTIVFNNNDHCTYFRCFDGVYSAEPARGVNTRGKCYWSHALLKTSSR
jgi:hypothetical protein